MGERENDGIPADWGVSLVADQQINETVQVFARWGYADGAVANIKNYVQGGAGFRGLMGEPNDMAGIAFSYAFPERQRVRTGEGAGRILPLAVDPVQPALGRRPGDLRSGQRTGSRRGGRVLGAAPSFLLMDGPAS